MEWLRWFHGTTSDPKLRMIAERSNTTVANVVAIWAALLENASASENRGTLSGWNSEDIAFSLGVTDETVVTVCNAMKRRGLFHTDSDRLTNWEKRNPIRERHDDSTERVQRFREKQKALKMESGVTPPVTPRNAKKHPDKIRLEEKEKEKEARALLQAGFAEIWESYPEKSGRKEAERHFNASVNSPEDLANIRTALLKYKAHLSVNSWKQPQSGKTWFNNWRDWVGYVSSTPTPGVMPAVPKAVC